MIKLSMANLKSMARVAKAGIVKHSPEILMGVGAVSFVGTVIVASRATIKAQDILYDHHEKLDDIKQAESMEIYTEEDAKKDKITLYTQTTIAMVKDYAPAAGLGVLSLASFFAAFGIIKKRYTTLAIAYNALSESFALYRKRVIEDKGEEADLYYLTGQKIKEVTVKDEEGKKKKVKVLELPDGTELASPYAFKFGKYRENGEKNKQWSNDPNYLRMYVLGQQDWLNDQLYMNCIFDDDHRVIKRGCVFLNEARVVLGEDPTTSGAVTGWRYSNGEEGCNGYIDFHMIEATEIDPADGKEIPCIIINPNVDGLIYDLVEQFEEIPFEPTYDKLDWND